MNFSAITKRTKKRLLHHLLIPLVCFALTGLLHAVLFQFYPDSQQWIFRWSLATGYIAALLLAATLTLGAWNILRKRVNPVSSDLRRDIGIWCALFSLAHVGFGLNVHMQRWTQYFIDDAGRLLTDAFGFANYSGVLATIIVLVLLATSNDVSLRFFKRERWKAIQRCNYVFAFLVVAHGFVYQFVEKRLLTFGFIFGVIALWILIIQFAGFRKRRREMRITTTVSQN
jgi:sulfoxide reductase heme-binding subunit YedZ